jgi:hypothetical protein
VIARCWSVVAALASGCTSLLDLAPGAALEPAPPSCATGWSYRIPIDVENRSSETLSDYQVAVPLDLREAAASGKLAQGETDLRFALDEDTPPLAFTVDRDLASRIGTAWVAVPDLPVGSTRIYAYYGNAEAPPRQLVSPFISDIVFNPSFETSGSWTRDTTSRAFEISTGWASDGKSSLAGDVYRTGKSIDHLDMGVSQLATFPSGTDYVLLFDVNVLAASNSGIGGESNGIFFVSVGDGLTWVWNLDGAQGNITGVHRDMETEPFGPGSVGIFFGISLRPGNTQAYAKGFYDNIRVRRHVATEPEIRVGAEEDACAR